MKKFGRKDSRASISSMNNSNYDKREDSERPLEQYRQYIKMPHPSPLNKTYDNFDERLDNESDIYSPLQKNRGDNDQEKHSTLKR